MIDHYNAFISYKHSPLDNKVAETVQKELEHFHIPDKKKKTSGMKRIQRVFRDKDELPITSDLSDTISNALEHSDYLIVICSTRTKESIWVSREIEYFLRNHSKRQILTVLVDGEPQDVIPEILQYEDRIITDEYGRTQTIRTPLEPLSCDFRTSFSKAKKVEIPRLASALIGCSYDELMNRRRQYMMRQMILAFSGILLLMSAFIGYMFYTRHQIKENYLSALTNQSRYLANESAYLMENEQRITALQLALEALPKDKDDKRPVIPEAVSALTKSTLAYSSAEANSIHAVWNYHMTNQVTDFILSPDTSTMAAYDYSDFVFVWNTSSHETIFSKHYSKEHICGIKYITKDTLLVWTDTKMRYFNIYKDELLWEMESVDYSFNSDEPKLIEDDLILTNAQNSKFITIDLKDGAVKDTYSLETDITEVVNTELTATTTDAIALDIPEVDIPEVDIPDINIPDTVIESASQTDAAVSDASETDAQEDEVMTDIAINRFTLSEDKNYIAFTTYLNWSYYVLGVYDIRTGKTIYTKYSEWIKDIHWLDNEHILVTQTSDTMNSNMSVGNQSIVTDNTNHIYCLNAKDLSTYWKNEFISTDVSLSSSFLDLPSADAIAYYTGNIAEILDKKTGNVLNRYNVNSSIVDISDTNEDGTPVLITTDGGVAIPTDTPNTVSIVRYLTEDLDKAIAEHGFYAHQEFSNDIIYYGVNVYDNEWQELSDDTVPSEGFNETYLNDQFLVLLNTNQEAKLLIYRLGDKTHCTSITLNDDSTVGYTILGIYNDKLYLATRVDDVMTLMDVDVNSGKIGTRDISSSFSLPSETMTMKDDTIYYIEQDENLHMVLNCLSISSGKTKTMELPEEATTNLNIVGGYLEGNYIYLNDDTESDDYLVDLNEEKIIKIEKPERWDRTFNVAVSDGKEKLIAINDSTNIAIFDTKGNQVQYIDSRGNQTYGLSFFTPKGKKSKPQLVVAYSDQSLKRYDIESGDMLDETMIEISAFAASGLKCTESDDKSLLFFQNEGILNIIDTNEWITLCSIHNCIGYYKPKDIILTYGYAQDGQNKVGYFKHYTIGDLIEKAHSILQGATLSDELKDKYGLTDD